MQCKVGSVIWSVLAVFLEYDHTNISLHMSGFIIIRAVCSEAY